MLVSFVIWTGFSKAFIKSCFSGVEVFHEAYSALFCFGLVNVFSDDALVRDEAVAGVAVGAGVGVGCDFQFEVFYFDLNGVFGCEFYFSSFFGVVFRYFEGAEPADYGDIFFWFI